MTTALARRAGAVTIIAAAAAALAGCGGGIGAQLTFSDTEKVKVTEIALSGAGGDVTVTTAAITEARITRIIQHSTDPRPSYRVRGTVLALDGDCGPGCTVSYRVEAPVGVQVRGEVGSGDVDLTGVGGAQVRVHSGNVRIRDAAGPVTVRAASGDVDVTGVEGGATVQAASGDVRVTDVSGAVNAEANSGDLDVTLSTTASVHAEVASGDLTVAVPAGSYAVRTETGSGDVRTTGITHDRNAPNVLGLTASSGDITVTGR